MSKAWAVTLGLFGLRLTFHIPGGHLLAFAIGVIFWMISGPFIKWAIKKAVGEIRKTYGYSRAYALGGVRL